MATTVSGRPAAPAARRRRGPLRRALGGVRGLAVLPARDPFALVGVLIYAAFILVAIFADALATHEPLKILLEDGKLARSVPPGADHFLGTTVLGRDIYSQLVHGTRSA